MGFDGNMYVIFRGECELPYREIEFKKAGKKKLGRTHPRSKPTIQRSKPDNQLFQNDKIGRQKRRWSEDCCDDSVGSDEQAVRLVAMHDERRRMKWEAKNGTRVQSTELN